MTKLLSIGLPTYNRSRLLDTQLSWLAQAIKGYESECEIIVSDNCSSDDSLEVIDKWAPSFRKASFRVNRQSQNVGVIRNIAYCMNSAKGKHVWTISDDDQIGTKTLGFVLDVLGTYPDLALMILNFSCRNSATGKLTRERWFDFEEDDVVPDGKSMFERSLQVYQAGGVTLTTAQVYRTDLAHWAWRDWPSALNQLAFQIYITGFCALHGSVKVTRDVHLDCAIGDHVFQKDDRVFLTFRFAEMPEVYVKLMEMGYSKEICRKMVLLQSGEMCQKKEFFKRCLKRFPVTAINILMRHIVAVWRVHSGVRISSPLSTTKALIRPLMALI